MVFFTHWNIGIPINLCNFFANSTFLQDLLQMNSSDPRLLLFRCCKTLEYESWGPSNPKHHFWVCFLTATCSTMEWKGVCHFLWLYCLFFSIHRTEIFILHLPFVLSLTTHYYSFYFHTVRDSYHGQESLVCLLLRHFFYKYPFSFAGHTHLLLGFASFIIFP